jgi:hypothetical protein
VRRLGGQRTGGHRRGGLRSAAEPLLERHRAQPNAALAEKPAPREQSRVGTAIQIILAAHKPLQIGDSIDDSPPIITERTSIARETWFCQLPKCICLYMFKYKRNNRGSNGLFEPRLRF